MKNNILKTFRYGWKSRKIWWYIASSRTKARFSRTIFGGLWIGLSNLLSTTALAFVYGTIFGVEDLKSYFVYLCIGITLWNTIASSINNAPFIFENNKVQILNNNTNYVFYTLEDWAFQAQTFFQSISFVLIILSFLKPDLILNLFTFGILPLLNFLIFMYWAPLAISIYCLRYKDLYQLIPIILQILFLVSPIFYLKKSLGELYWIADYNFIFKFVETLREALINSNLEIKSTLILFSLNVLGLILAIYKLNKERNSIPFQV